MTKYDEIQVGDNAEIEHVVTARDIEKFIDLTGDDNRLHTDATYAARTSFKKPLAHGMLGASFISTVIGTKLPGDGALWFEQNLAFLLPVRVGDTLTIRVQVTKKIDRLQVIELQTDILNQSHQKVTTGVARVKIIEAVVAPDVEERPNRRVALVIGGSGGIGSAICRMLAKDGYDVAVHYFRNANAANALVEEIRGPNCKAWAVGGDVTSEISVAGIVNNVVRHLDTVTVLVNCSTSDTATNRFADLTWDDISKHLDMAVRSNFYLIQAVLPLMERQRYGKIILIGSQNLEAPAIKILPYITSKGAMVGFARALALELAPKGIRVNMVSPSMADTDLIANVPEKERLLAAARTPLRRLATPDDVAGAVSFLASERSDFLTGETIRVNGGQNML